MTKNVIWKYKYGYALLPVRRECKPEGRIVLFGKTLSVEETRAYCNTLQQTRYT